MKFRNKLIAAVSAMVVGAAAQAAPFFIDTTSLGTANVPGDNSLGANLTSMKEEMTLKYRSRTVVTDTVLPGGGVSAGDTITTHVGIGTPTNANGTGASTLAENAITSLNPGGPFSGFNDQGYGSSWGMTFSSTTELTGTIQDVVGGVPILSLTGGVISMYAFLSADANNPAAYIRFMDIIISNTVNAVGGSYLVGTADFSSPLINTAYADLFHSGTASCNGDTSFYGIFTNCGTTSEIFVPIDFNSNSQVGNFAPLGGNLYGLSTNHDGSVTFAVNVSEVPEPGSLALVGVALVGLGALRRRMK